MSDAGKIAEEIIARNQEVQKVQDDRIDRWTSKGRVDFHFKLAQGGATVDVSIDSKNFTTLAGSEALVSVSTPTISPFARVVCSSSFGLVRSMRTTLTDHGTDLIRSFRKATPGRNSSHLPPATRA